MLCATATGVVARGGVARAARAGGTRRPAAGLRVTFLDVGQGDAILLQPAAAPPVLVDGGPSGDGLAAQLGRRRRRRASAAAVVTHDQSDHAGGIAEALGESRSAGSLYAVADRRPWSRRGRPAPGRGGSRPAAGCAPAVSAST